jgi:hypothetical protein
MLMVKNVLNNKRIGRLKMKDEKVKK